MLGDLMGMMGKLKDAQEKVRVTKKRLDSVSMKESSPDGLLEVVVTANREVKEILIDPSLLKDREQLSDYLVITLNKALSKAGEVHDAELSAVAKDGIPDIPGLDNFLK